MVSVAMSDEIICELVFAHKDKSLNFILEYALSEKLHIFCGLNVQTWRLIGQMRP